MLKFGELRKKSKKRKTENQRCTQNKKEELIMSVGKFIGMYGDDAFRIAQEAFIKQAAQATKDLKINPCTGLGDIFTQLQGVTGRTTFTLEGKALQGALKELEYLPNRHHRGIGDFIDVVKQMIAKCKNPSVTIGAKASKQGFNVAGISLRDGEKLVASGAVSITTKATKAGVQPQIVKSRFNTADGMINARSFVDTTKAPRMTDKIALNLNADDLVANAYARAGDTYGAQAHLDVNKLLPYFASKSEVAQAVKYANAQIAEKYAYALGKAGLK